MKENIKNISKELELLANTQLQLGLKNGYMGIVLYFFYYSRFIGEEKYEIFANELLDKILTEIPNYNSYDFASDFTDIGRILDFLNNENFLEVDKNEFVDFFENPLLYRLKLDVGADFSFYYGIIGICDFFINRKNYDEALNITIQHLYSGLKVKGYSKHFIDSIFLFPSEVLRDVKIFIYKLEKLNISFPDKELLYDAILKLESKNILQSNCPEYIVLQDIREANLMNNQQKIESSLKIIASSSSNLIYKGMASMYLINNDLPAWWKLI